MDDLMADRNAASMADAVEVSIYLQNCYLVPYGFTFNPVFWGCTRQEERSRGIGEMAAKHDLALLQEVRARKLQRGVGRGVGRGVV